MDTFKSTHTGSGHRLTFHPNRTRYDNTQNTNFRFQRRLETLRSNNTYYCIT